MFKTSDREAFCDAWKALKSVFGRGSARGNSGCSLGPLVGWGGEPSSPQRIAPSPDILLVAKVDHAPTISLNLKYVLSVSRLLETETAPRKLSKHRLTHRVTYVLGPDCSGFEVSVGLLRLKHLNKRHSVMLGKHRNRFSARTAPKHLCRSSRHSHRPSSRLGRGHGRFHGTIRQISF